MKKKTTLLLHLSFLFFCSTLHATNYYWVGGTGTWSDFAAHWATTSGGTVFHVTIPSPGDDVFFDANSFPTAGDSVLMDTTITNCHTIDWSAATNSPAWSGNINLQVYGSFILNSNMQWHMFNGSVTFMSSASGNIINTAGLGLHYVFNWDDWGTSIAFNGNGSWDLQSTLDLGTQMMPGSIAITSGTLLTHGYAINCHDFSITGQQPTSVFLDTSLINCENGDWTVYSSGNIQLDADSCLINCGGFHGGLNNIYADVNAVSIEIFTKNCWFHDVQSSDVSSDSSHYHYVTMNTSYNSIHGTGNTFTKVTMPGTDCDFSGTNTFDTLIMNNPGQTININSNAVVAINNLIQADGSCSVLTSISSPGTGTISKSSGVVNFSYVLLQNITGAGGAAFTANNSVDGGNVAGITINAPLARTLFWVGGSGNWSDVNHWSLASGGAGGSCVPSQSDDVYFDANSFPTANDSVYINTATIYCHTIDWSAATNSPAWSGNIHLQVYGSFILNSNMQWHMFNGSVTFMSSASGNIINTAGLGLHYVFNWDDWGTSIAFNGNGSWDLQSTLDLGTQMMPGSIAITSGTLLTHGYAINCHDFSITGQQPTSVFLDTSLINCENGDWTVYSSGNIQLDADSCLINCGGFHGGLNNIYADVNAVSIEIFTKNCWFHDVQSSDVSSDSSHYHYVTMNTSYNSIHGTGNTFTKVTMPGTDCDFSGTNTFDTLIMNNPGQTININSNAVVAINNLIQADGSCSVLTSISSPGTGTISKSSGVVNFSYVLLQNITGAGGAAFTANNSVDGGNVAGITINAPLARTLFWVGGSGNWSDVNHWSLASGGAGGSCVPSQSDDVYFDANSFPTANDSVYINTATIYCHTIDWSAATNSPAWSGTIHLQVYGSFILNSNMQWHMFNGSVTFMSSASGNIINTAGLGLHYVFNWDDWGTSIAFNGNGSWDLQSTLDLGTQMMPGSIAITSGTLLTHGYAINCHDFSITGQQPTSVFLDTSLINCENGDWTVYSSGNIQLDADSCLINCGGFHGGLNNIYADVNAVSLEIFTKNCWFHDVQSSDVSSDSSHYHYVTMNTSYNSIHGTGNTFKKVTMPGIDCDFSGTNTFDTLIMNNPGQTININSNAVVAINNDLFIQSDPGFPTSIECNGGTGTISKPTDTVCADFIYLKNILATGGAIYFAGDHSVDLGGNTGWNWVRCAPLFSNVWPGDCNYDLVTDNFDLLNIGVSYGDTGYVRAGASLSYVAQTCQDWYYQFINGVNVKHADCDGNGVVDANDSTAIALNYGLTHPARLVHQDESNTTGAPLEFVLPPVIVPGSIVSVPIELGTSVIPANGIYGIAFTVDYDPAFIQAGTMNVDYSGSWVESAGNHLHLEKDFPGAGKTDVAFTRIDHSDVSGYGIIATLNFTVSSTANGPFNLSFSHVRVISHNEIDIPVQTGTSTTHVNIDETENEISSSVYPNPMTDEAQIIFNNVNHDTWSFSIKDVTGRIVGSERIVTGNIVKVEKKNLRDGVYFYTLKNAEGKTGKGKLIVE